MNADLLFKLASTFVLMGWILLIFFPRWNKSGFIVEWGIAGILALAYTVLVLSGLGQFNPESFSTLASVKALFQEDSAVVAGWIHYLCFDLLTGLYIVRKAYQSGFSHWIAVLCLPFTFMFGPMGFLLFSIIRLAKGKVTVSENL